MEYLLNLLLIAAVPFVVCDESNNNPNKPDRCNVSPELLVVCDESNNNPNKPDRCNVSPELLYRQCCIFPPFFSKDTAKDCGAMFQVLPFDRTSNSSGFRVIAYDVCKYWKCILKTNHLLGSDGNADIGRYFVHLDKWVELYSPFSNVMLHAKIFCKQRNTLKLPLKACEFHHLHRCIRNYIDVHCPIVVPTELCKEQREFYLECAEYYV